LLGDVGTVFHTSVAIIVAFVLVAMLDPEAVERTASGLLDATATRVGWMYLLMILMAWSLYRDLSLESRRLAEREVLLRERLERWVLREAEREAEEATHPTVAEEPPAAGEERSPDERG